jgi:hypothetical protein
MADPIKRALTRRRIQRGKLVSEEPNEKLVYVVKFALGMTACLSGLEVAHMAFLHSWNAEIFVAISSLITFVSGIIIGQKAS